MQVPQDIADENRRDRINVLMRNLPDYIALADPVDAGLRDAFRRMISFTWTEPEFCAIERDLHDAIRRWNEPDEEDD